MKFWRAGVLWGGFLLARPQAARASEINHIIPSLETMGLLLLAVLAGGALLVSVPVLLTKLLARPEAAIRRHRVWYALAVGGLTVPAVAILFLAVAVWTLPQQPGSRQAWLLVQFGGCAAATLALCAGLWWQRRPTAAWAVAGGLASAAVLLLASKHWPSRATPVPLGLVGTPAFKEAAFPLGRSQPDSATASKVYTYVEQMPGFKGTGVALKKLVDNELHYPDLARDQGTTGIVQVTFIIQPDGSLTDARVTMPLSEECNAEALRVVKLLAPYFSPGSQNGQLVSVQETLSFGFGPTPASAQ
jgi:TonB family protein